MSSARIQFHGVLLDEDKIAEYDERTETLIFGDGGVYLPRSRVLRLSDEACVVSLFDGPALLVRFVSTADSQKELDRDEMGGS